jgi:Tfp pilus assembly protein PilN
MSLGSMNLARRPFVNARPVARLGALLWVAGAILLAINVVSIWSYLAGSAEKRAAIARAEATLAEESRRIAALESELGSMDLERQNEEVDFLNRRIADRTFAWSRLFDDLAEVLPLDVRVNDLSPLGVEGERARRSGARRARRAPESVSDGFPLRIGGVARDGEVLLQFVDNLFAHPAFANPDLASEAREGTDLRFDVSVTYRPLPAPDPSEAQP